MIPLSRVVTEIEKYVSIAKEKDDERSIREALLAIRALSDVALSEQPDVKSSSVQNQKPNPISEVKSISSGERMKEADANGDSLFDF
ncbi:DUF5327 family protein [Paenisporosarcina sp. TG20]|uniref:DUF5327 family protein n=1 Tax=Paenisporosarcina sp. TG20 TaxID=1211706 RepID=UPI00030CDAD8|nr:DUF5327 family protein [Paenisporosarcina sp. TG20]